MGQVLTLAEAQTLSAELRAAGRVVVLTNGHFDLLHVGHLDYLERARALGDALIVGVNADASTRRLKGPGRPFVPDAERARLLAALACVDAAVVFAEDTAVALVQAVRPALYVKGGDYTVETLPEAPAVTALGGRIALLPLVPERSTRDLIARIRAAPNPAPGTTAPDATGLTNGGRGGA